MTAIIAALWPEWLPGPGPVPFQPQLTLRYSDDGGQTWSNEKKAYGGAIGNYLARVIWRQLGSGRDRVFEVFSTDAIQHIWCEAYLEVTQGAD
jgi:hypothetical protein